NMEVKVKINNQKWKVKFLSDEEMEKISDDEDTCLDGLTDKNLKIIYIRKNCGDLLSTIRHECYHAYFEQLCLEDSKEMMVEEFEEISARFFENNSLDI